MTKIKKVRPNRILNDLIEASFQTPPELVFIRYGKRKAIDYKVSKHPDTEMHLIETIKDGTLKTKWVSGWDKAIRHLAYLSSKKMGASHG